MSIPIEIITDDVELTRAGFHWREKEGVLALSCTPLEQDGFPNAFSTRLGGVSPMPENALNLAGFNDDTAENIYENRRRFLKLFDGDWALAACWQVHGTQTRVVKSREDADRSPGATGEPVHCDALVTNASSILLGVKTADCVPVILADSRTGAIAAIHAGWRGTLQSIVRNTLARMSEAYSTCARDVSAAIGPAANACCYEVGSDVIEAFKQKFPNSEHLFKSTREGHALVDLQRANREQLIGSGVEHARIHTAPLCTMCRNDLFFSYRKEKRLHGRVGRLMTTIGREDGRDEG
ncbi:MAG TPA: peptidoglycan editing factor PgeF [Pyrinomonadaceae bacterium]|nr:peptidoglycan editing factor PgeF [Pyrinomonadaceae bacterium]